MGWLKDFFGNAAQEPTKEEPFYNLPFTPTTSRYDVYVDIIKKFADGRRLEILEIGVFRAGIMRRAMETAASSIASYTGVDPYIGDETDPYHHSYWKSDKSVAETQYDASKALFDKFGQTLIREKSDDFFKNNSRQFDVVIVDGDHRLEPAFRDLLNALAALRPGGLLICDDYGNSDTPDVTRAVGKFISVAGDFYDAAGYKPIWFQNAGKPAPIQLTALYWRKKK